MEEKEPKLDIATKDPEVINSQEKMNQDDQDKATNAEEENIKKEEENFDYLEPREKEEPSIFNYSNKENDINESENIFKPMALIGRYIICILLKEDDTIDSILLKHTLDGIISNFGGLSELGIGPDNVLIYVFVNKLKKKENKENKALVPNELIKSKLNKENKESYLLTHMKLKGDERDIKIEIVSKRNYMSDIEALECFYCQIVQNLKEEKKILITSVITAGVIPTNNALSDLINACLMNDEDRNKKKSINDCVSIPALEINEKMGQDSFFGNIAKYERVHFNIYDMNCYYSAGSVPVLSLMNTMTIDKELLSKLIAFYVNIDIKNDVSELPKINYHDYNLGLFLYKNNIKIKYLSKQSFGTIIYRDFDYKNLWISKYSGYYSNFFDIVHNLVDFNLPIIHKIFMLFQIIGMLIEFIYPGLSILVIYSIFVEAFDIIDRYPAWFMTMLYIIMYLGSGVSSLISYKTKDVHITSMIYYYFMEVYYLFILVCSVPAMDNIKKKKLFGEKMDDVDGFYKFNVAAISCLIVFTVVVAILPMILRLEMITSNIVPMLLYLLFGAPLSTSNFLIAKIWNAPEAPGGETVDDRRGILILFYLLSNLFFGFLSVYIYDRKLRANCVMGLGIFYLIYLFFKIIGIVLSLLGSPDLSQQKSSKTKSILKRPGIFESKNSSDHMNEEKLDENENENNENNENNEEENNNKDNDEKEEQNNDNNDD